MIEIDRLGKEVVSPEAHGLDGLVDAAVAGRDDDRNGQPAILNLADHGHAVETRHAQVGDHERSQFLFEQLFYFGLFCRRKTRRSPIRRIDHMTRENNQLRDGETFIKGIRLAVKLTR